MSLHLYDTATRSLREFQPREPGKASIYLCGLTVQGPPHIGHVRNWINMDILRRWLEHNHYDVTFVRNVTDIDDKILTKAAAAGEPWWALAFRNERELVHAEEALGCRTPSYEPRATGHVPEMIVLMQRLIERGHAYAADGDVYFDVQSWPAYGSLSGQKVDEMQAAGDSAGDSRKRDPRDFALWKSAKPGEPSWPTPWGDGRPGWHLECSAMATKYLGTSFDIHGGGLDLVFPHHENELAQSAAAGDGFANFWMHNGLVTMAGEKMSKSLGNTLQVREMVKEHDPLVLRYYLGAAHYRSTIEFSAANLAQAQVACGRISRFFAEAGKLLAGSGIAELPDAELPAAFVNAMNDDLAVPAALAVIHDAIKPANTTISEANLALGLGDVQAFARVVAEIRGMTRVLGIYPGDWSQRTASNSDVVVDYLVRAQLARRDAARAVRDWALADSIRNEMASFGIVVKDSPAGSDYVIKEEP